MLTVYLRHDMDTENPNDNGGWKLYSFNRKHSNYKKFESFAEEDIKGKAYWVSYYEHGNCWWGLCGSKTPAGVEFDWDGVCVAGVLFWEGDGDPPDEESAKSFLKEYTRWSNGECYLYEVYDEEDNLVDSCGGFIGYDYVIEMIREATQDKEFEIVSEKFW
jgi:hypothetical protein